MVSALLERGVRHADVRRAIARLGCYGEWPLSDAPLATTVGNGRPGIVLRTREGVYALADRGWQLVATPLPTEDVRLRLRRT